MVNQKKTFTPSEANKMIPLVKNIVRDIMDESAKLKIILEKKDDSMLEEIDNLQEEIKSLIDELEELGCYYKDWNFEYGLVDFPAVINGIEVVLCWRSDEDGIEWYHGIDSGFAGRVPIPENLLAEAKVE